MRKAASRRREVPRFELEDQLPRLLPEMTAGFARQAVDPAVDARQRCVVRPSACVINDRVDQRARSLSLTRDLGILRIVELPAELVAHLIGRVLHLCDHHPAQRERALHGQDVDPRQMRVGRNISRGQLVQQMTHPSNHQHRQDGCCHHQDNQADGDGDDPAPDRLLDHRSGERLQGLK